MAFRVRKKYGSDRGPSISADGSRKYSATYIIQADIDQVGTLALLNYTGMPRLGQPHPRDWGAFCDRVDPRQLDDSQKIIEVAVEWNSKTTDPAQRKKPLERPPVVRESFIQIHRTLPKDLNGKAFLNSFGTPFDPPPEIPLVIQQFTISWYTQSYDPKTDAAYMNAANSDKFLSADAGYALISDINRESSFEEGLLYWHTTVTVQIADKALEKESGELSWENFCVLDAGYRYFDKDGKETLPTDKNDVMHNGLVLLDGKNGKLSTEAKYIKFRIRNKKPFKDLIKL